jgi:hypothetical protein
MSKKSSTPRSSERQREELRPSWNGQRSWSSARHALVAIYGVLDPKPSVTELRQVGNLGGVPDNQTAYLLASAAFDACASYVWAWYQELLLRGDDDLCEQAKNFRRELCYEVLADRLGQLSNPLEGLRLPISRPPSK